MAYLLRPFAGFALAVSLSAPLYAVQLPEDSDGDGHSSIAEMQTVVPTLTEGTFAVIDTSGDGVLSVQEIENATLAGLLPR